MSVFSFAQNIVTAYKNLSKPEKSWVKHHLIAAVRVRSLSQYAAAKSRELIDDKYFDGDQNGGMIDAFRHTFWMALVSQKIGSRKALLLGKAHEAGNRLQFFEGSLEDGSRPDSISCEMDLLNNQKGVLIGQACKHDSRDKIMSVAKTAVLKGECYKIKKDSSGNFLDYDGNIIDIKLVNDNWFAPKILVKSDFNLRK